MKTRILLPEPDDWTEGIPYRIVCASFEHRSRLTWLLNWHVKIGRSSDARLTAYDFLREMGLYMPRKGKQNGSITNNGNDGSSGKGSGTKWVWGNCKLSDEDIANLHGDESTLEYLATCIASLANDGYGVSLKSVDKGESRCCTINRPDYPGIGTTIGVSAFGGNIRDAILTCLYKLDNYGGGDFTGFDVEEQSNGTRPRFR